MLKFLTGDIWSISFTKRKVVLDVEEGTKTASFDAISLFSGGMDSLISTVNLQEEGKNVLLAAHANEGLVKKAQTDIVRELDNKYPELKHLLVDLWTSIPKDIIAEGGEENTTRSRSFLFIAYATFIASGTANLKELLVPENGLIAINVPMDSMRVGAHSTRTTHPFYLASWNQLLKKLQIDFSIRNPYWNKTKGEMAAECLNQEFLYEVMPLSMSCSSPGKERYQGLSPQHCGYCLPCLIRRAAMHRAFGKDNTTYANVSVEEMVNERQQEKGIQMRSVQYAIERVKEYPDFANYAIFKPGPLDKDSIYLSELADTYYRGLMEVDKWIQDSQEKEHAN
jgi:7-cyano-7-deazaguanine synthase in queuosine biosynthesis